ncbi:MAG: malectin domain-containing carbohydrate-binding protein, partial [Desulfosarcinaceae bacterium]
MRTIVTPLRLCFVILFPLLSLCFLVVGNALAVDVTLAWDRTVASDLAGYKVYYRTCPAGEGCTGIGVVDDLNGLTVPLGTLADRDAPQFVATGLPSESDFVFVVTAYTSSGTESGFSNEAYYRAPTTDPNGGGSTTDDQAPTVPDQLDGATHLSTNGDSIVLTWGKSSDNVGVSTYVIYRDGTEIGTTADTAYADTAVVAGNTYVYTIAAVDATGNRSDISSPLSVSLPSADVSDGASENVVLRVNCGGGRYVDTGGNAWAADSGYNTGKAAFESAEITGTSEDALYRSNRWDPNASPELEYRFKLANGSYLIKLHFAETWSGAFGTGIRRFNIQIEDALVERNLDIFSEVGANAALVRSYPVTLTDGQLNLRFLHAVQNPQINAIEVLSATAAD